MFLAHFVRFRTLFCHDARFMWGRGNSVVELMDYPTAATAGVLNVLGTAPALTSFLMFCVAVKKASS